MSGNIIMSEPRELIPDAYRTTAHRLASGSVVITQSGESGDQIIIIPPGYIKAFCDGVYRVGGQGVTVTMGQSPESFVEAWAKAVEANKKFSE